MRHDDALADALIFEYGGVTRRVHREPGFLGLVNDLVLSFRVCFFPFGHRSSCTDARAVGRDAAADPSDSGCRIYARTRQDAGLPRAALDEGEPRR
jgi:hypothetical protein